MKVTSKGAVPSVGVALNSATGESPVMINPSVSVKVPSVEFCTFTSQLPMVASLGMAKSALRDVLDDEVVVPLIVVPSLENQTAVTVGVPCPKWVFSPVMVTDNSCPCNALSGEMDWREGVALMVKLQLADQSPHMFEIFFALTFQ